MTKVADAKAALAHLKRNSEKSTDIRNLHELLPKLGDVNVLALYLRYWESMTIQEIAKILGRTWSDTDRLIEESIAELRENFAALQLLEHRQPEAA